MGLVRDRVSPSSPHIPSISNTAECQNEEEGDGKMYKLQEGRLAGWRTHKLIQESSLARPLGKRKRSHGNMEHCQRLRQLDFSSCSLWLRSCEIFQNFLEITL